MNLTKIIYPTIAAAGLTFLLLNALKNKHAEKEVFDESLIYANDEIDSKKNLINKRIIPIKTNKYPIIVQQSENPYFAIN